MGLKKNLVLFALVTAVFAFCTASVFKEKEDAEHLSLCMEIFEILQDAEDGLNSASVQNILNTISYTNAKITDKYRLSAILNYVEKYPFDTVAENMRRELSYMFGSCKIYKKTEFYENTTRIYNDYLAKSETDLATEKAYDESFVGSRNLSSERKTFHGFYSASGEKLTAPETKVVPLYRVENIKKSSGKLLAALCFKGCAKKGSLSPDGGIWIGGNNYLFAFSSEAPPAGKEERPIIMLLCKPTSGAEGSLSSFDNRELFERKGAVADNLKSDSVFEIFEIRSVDPTGGFVCGERDISSGFLAFDFSLFSNSR